MPVINCKKCGTPYSPAIGDVVCQVCKEEEIAVFHRVREYIRAHPGATVDDIAIATGIDERAILRFINQGRLLKR